MKLTTIENVDGRSELLIQIDQQNNGDDFTVYATLNHLHTPVALFKCQDKQYCVSPSIYAENIETQERHICISMAHLAEVARDYYLKTRGVKSDPDALKRGQLVGIFHPISVGEKRDTAEYRGEAILVNRIAEYPAPYEYWEVRWIHHLPMSKVLSNDYSKELIDTQNHEPRGLTQEEADKLPTHSFRQVAQ